MEVEILREKIITAFLIYKFGKENVNTEVPITKSEIDVLLYAHPNSIKTITGKTLKSVKLAEKRIKSFNSQEAIEF